MTQYIDKDALVAYIKSCISDIKISQKAGFIKKRDANKRIIFFESILSFIDTLEVKEVGSKEIIIPRWFFENIEDTLRVQYNINLEKDGETCQDRNIKGSLNGVRKLLYGKELTGMERLEKLIPYTSEVKEVDLEKALSDLDKDIKEFVITEEFERESKTCGHYWTIAKHAFLLGIKAQKEE